jgi:iron-sulfur cluster assembly protein
MGGTFRKICARLSRPGGVTRGMRQWNREESDMFKVTPQAARQVKVAAEQGGTAGMALRLAAQQRPDGTIDYRMGFDEATEDDIRFSSEGVQIVMAPEYVPLLDAATLDFVELDAGDPQFIFLNPKDATYVAPSEN